MQTTGQRANKGPGSNRTLSRWLSAADEIARYLKRPDPGKQVAEDVGARALLENASSMLVSAGTTISRQTDRIRALESLAVTDELTGLMNRRGFINALIRELDRVDRGQSLGGLVILIDIDNFTAVNKIYGPAAGDAVLQAVGRALGAETRRMDVAARLEQDEFVLLLADAMREHTLERAQNLIRKLNRLSVLWYGADIPVRASLGIREYQKGDAAQTVIGDAGTQLYSSKSFHPGETGFTEQLLR